MECHVPGLLTFANSFDGHRMSTVVIAGSLELHCRFRADA
jgi:hypothetical protein